MEAAEHRTDRTPRDHQRDGSPRSPDQRPRGPPPPATPRWKRRKLPQVMAATPGVIPASFWRHAAWSMQRRRFWACTDSSSQQPCCSRSGSKEAELEACDVGWRTGLGPPCRRWLANISKVLLWNSGGTMNSAAPMNGGHGTAGRHPWMTKTRTWTWTCRYILGRPRSFCAISYQTQPALHPFGPYLRHLKRPRRLLVRHTNMISARSVHAAARWTSEGRLRFQPPTGVSLPASGAAEPSYCYTAVSFLQHGRNRNHRHPQRFSRSGLKSGFYPRPL